MLNQKGLNTFKEAIDRINQGIKNQSYPDIIMGTCEFWNFKAKIDYVLQSYIVTCRFHDVKMKWNPIIGDHVCPKCKKQKSLEDFVVN